MDKPDWGQGVSDFKNKALMVLMAMMGMPGVGAAAGGGGGLGGNAGIEAIGNMGTAASSGGQGQQSFPSPNFSNPIPQGGVGDSATPQFDPQLQQLMMMLTKMFQGGLQ